MVRFHQQDKQDQQDQQESPIRLNGESMVRFHHSKKRKAPAIMADDATVTTKSYDALGVGERN